jgi:hypothetical protein
MFNPPNSIFYFRRAQAVRRKKLFSGKNKSLSGRKLSQFDIAEQEFGKEYP